MLDRAKDASSMQASRTVPVTMIVAATKTMGVGAGGKLPWPALRGEMGYFSRVSKRAAPDPSLPASSNYINAVVMGRKTWLSIPPKFRPLKGRVNVVLSRDVESLGFRTLGEGRSDGAVEGPYAASHIEAAIDGLHAAFASPAEGSPAPALSRIYVIGGAEVYRSALDLHECRHILLTRIFTDFRCDTFFPLVLSQAGDYEGWVDADRAKRRGFWRKRSKEELDAFAGEDVPPGKQEEQGVEWEFELWEREEASPVLR